MSDDGGDGRLSAARKVIRDAAIIEAVRTGERVRDVAGRYGITVRQVNRIVKAYELEPTGVDEQPMEVVHRILRGYATQMRSFLALAEASADSMPAVAVAAIRGHVDALERYRELMAEIGKLPHDLALLRSEAALERLFEQMMGVVQRVAVGGLPADEALRELDRIRGVNVRPYELGPGDAHDV